MGEGWGLCNGLPHWRFSNTIKASSLRGRGGGSPWGVMLCSVPLAIFKYNQGFFITREGWGFTLGCDVV